MQWKSVVGSKNIRIGYFLKIEVMWYRNCAIVRPDLYETNRVLTFEEKCFQTLLQIHKKLLQGFEIVLEECFEFVRQVVVSVVKMYVCINRYFFSESLN